MKKVAILISGRGTTAEATIKACQNGKLKDIAPLVISSNPAAKGNQRVKKLGIKLYIIDRKKFSREEFDKKLLDLLEKFKVDIISLQGWLLLISPAIVKKYQGKIFNQHPGPMDPGKPDFGGAGMSTPYRVNSALLAYNWMTGENLAAESDTHFVTEEFDKGEVIRTQEMAVPVKGKLVTIEELRKNPDELIKTTHEVQKEFYPVEHQNVIATLQMFVNGEVTSFKRKKPLISKKNINVLNEAKKLATELFPNYNL